MKRKSSFGKIFFILILLVSLGAAGFVYFSPMFEKQKPTIAFENNKFWNLKEKLDLKLSDKSGIKYYKIIYKDQKNEIVLFDKVLETASKELSLKITPPVLDIFFKSKNVELIVEVVDNSKWNFLEGNKIRKSFKLLIDKKKPLVNIIANSYAIRHGGSAVIIAQIKDENLKDAFISFGNEKRFELIPFYKENYYMALIAWPVDIKEFTKVTLIALDKANNLIKTKVPLYIRELKVKQSNINISSSFIQNVSSNVLETSGVNIPDSIEDTFVKTNRFLRAINVDTIEKVSKKYMNIEQINEIKIKTFKRLKNAATPAGFANRRHYYLNNEKIDDAWHLGIDWASIKKADIYTSNKGRVIFNDYLGIYGNTVIVDHKYGLQTLYAHQSATSVSVGDFLDVGDKIGNTGTTGAVLGDHLHFGVLVQGIEVNPLEWMDKNWIKTRITNIIEEAKKVIDQK